jgi:hypothetical protein
MGARGIEHGGMVYFINGIAGLDSAKSAVPIKIFGPREAQQHLAEVEAPALFTGCTGRRCNWVGRHTIRRLRIADSICRARVALSAPELDFCQGLMPLPLCVGILGIRTIKGMLEVQRLLAIIITKCAKAINYRTNAQQFQRPPLSFSLD